MDRGAMAAVHGVAKSRTRLSDFIFTFHSHALEKEMETHSSVLDWRIPGMGEPGGLPSMGSHRVRHDLSDLAAAAAAGKILHATEQLNLCATTMEPVLKSPKATITAVHLEPVLCNKRSQGSQKPMYHNWREAPCCN